jgi:hypothetical protein
MKRQRKEDNYLFVGAWRDRVSSRGDQVKIEFCGFVT